MRKLMTVATLKKKLPRERNLKPMRKVSLNRERELAMQEALNKTQVRSRVAPPGSRKGPMKKERLRD